MASIKFILKSANNPASIYIRLTGGLIPGEKTKLENVKKVDVMAKTNFVINPSDWSKTKEQPKSLTDTGFKKLNTDLLDLKASLLKHYNDSNGKVPINTKWLKDFINPPVVESGPPVELISYFDFYIESKKKIVSQNSIKKYNVIKHKLIKYQSEHKTILLIKDINPNFQKLFEAFCDRHNYSHNTTTMEMRFIKTICRHANLNGISIDTKLETIKNKYEDVESIYLSEGDIFKIKEAKLTLDSLDNARDWLLISCYCGQRVSDLLRFTKNMIRYETNRSGKSVPLIEFEQVKTKKVMTLPLHSEIVNILNKRDGEFPRPISDVKYNDYIKKVCRHAKITELIPGSLKVETIKDSGIYRKQTGIFPKCDLVTSHIGRRSFATNFYGKIPTSLLIAATGHSTETMFLNYIGKSSSDRAKELAEYF